MQNVTYICQHMGASYSQRWTVPVINLSLSLSSEVFPQQLIILFHSQFCKSYLFCSVINVLCHSESSAKIPDWVAQWSFPRFRFSSYKWFLVLAVGRGIEAETLLTWMLPRHPVLLSPFVIFSYYNWIFLLYES